MTDVNYREKQIFKRFKEQIEKSHQNWEVKYEIKIGDLLADVRIDALDSEHKVVQSVVAYGEIKDEKADVSELLEGLAKAKYYSEQSANEAWLILPQSAIDRLLASKKKPEPKVKLYNLDTQQLINMETPLEKINKSRLKAVQDSIPFAGWEHEFTINTTTPIALDKPEYNNDNVMFNIGQRVKGIIRTMASVVSGSVSEAVKYTIYVEPISTPICVKQDLKHTEKLILVD